VQLRQPWAAELQEAPLDLLVEQPMLVRYKPM